MVNLKCTLTVKTDTKKLLPLVEKEFLKHHPEMAGINVTENMLVLQCFRFYIDPMGEKEWQ